MLGLIQADVAAARQAHLGDRTPALLMHFGALHVFFGQPRNFGLQVVAEEIQLVGAVLIGGMEGGFGGRQSKNEPAAAGIDGREPQHVAKKRAIGFGILAVENDVSARNHSALPVTRGETPSWRRPAFPFRRCRSWRKRAARRRDLRGFPPCEASAGLGRPRASRSFGARRQLPRWPA